jgi:CRP-like cAMP-binding protein
MNAQLEISNTEAHATKTPLSCVFCVGFDLGICSAMSGSEAFPGSPSLKIRQSAQVAPARRIIWRSQDLHEIVPVICSGWAAAIVMLSNGTRQIVSFLLPGDMISTTLLFEARPYCLIEAITDVRYRAFSRVDLKSKLFGEPELLNKFAKAWVDEKARADQLIVDLGRRTANERIARLILGLFDRLEKRGMVRGESNEFEFPLRQHHIADATGLTPVHVSKVLTEFRRSQLINISERSLTILDLPALRRIGHTR